MENAMKTLLHSAPSEDYEDHECEVAPEWNDASPHPHHQHLYIYIYSSYMRRIWEELRKSFECSITKYQQTLQQSASMSGVLQAGRKRIPERDGEFLRKDFGYTIPRSGIRLEWDYSGEEI